MEEEVCMGWEAWEECTVTKGTTKEDFLNELRCIYSSFVKSHRWLNAMQMAWLDFTQL